MPARTLVLLLLNASSAGAWLAGAPARPLVRRAAPPVAAAPADDGGATDAAEIMDAAKVDEEKEFASAMAAAAAAARSPEAVAARRTAAEAAAAALRDAVAAAGGKHAADAAKRGGKASGKLFKALKKPAKTMALIGEGVQIDELGQLMGGYDLDDPAYLGSEYRSAGCSAVCVRMVAAEALVPDALALTVAEQETARGDFPSPLAAIARDDFVDELQLAAAAAGGAKAVVLDLALVGAERAKELAEEAAGLGMESLVRACDAAEVAAAAELGASMIVIGDVTHEDASALLEGVPKGTLAIADVPTLDVRGVWKVRDLGFNALIMGASMLEVCVRDRVPPSAIIKAALSKGSVKYGLGMQKGRLEGSKEFLGSLGM